MSCGIAAYATTRHRVGEHTVEEQHWPMGQVVFPDVIPQVSFTLTVR